MPCLWPAEKLGVLFVALHCLFLVSFLSFWTATILKIYKEADTQSVRFSLFSKFYEKSASYISFHLKQ